MLIQFFLTAALLALLVMTIRRARQQAIRRTEALVWSLLWIAAIGIVWRPSVSTMMANVIGVGRGSDLALYVSVLLLFILVFRQFLAIDRLQREITEMVRHEALRHVESEYLAWQAKEIVEK